METAHSQPVPIWDTNSGKASKLGGVQYTICTNPGAYALVRKFLKEQKVEAVRLTTPTIYAHKNDQIIGVIGTTIKQGIPWMGPLTLAPDKLHTFVGLRLFDSYENYMRAVGVTSYCIFLDKTAENLAVRWLKDTMGVEPYASNDDGWFYIRKL